MPKIIKKELTKRYLKYRDVVHSFQMKGYSESESILKAALKLKVSERTIRNAINNRPGKSIK